MHGLVIPTALNNHIVLDCIDRIDLEKQRFCTNAYGWFYLADSKTVNVIANRLKNEGQNSINSAIEGLFKSVIPVPLSL